MAYRDFLLAPVEGVPVPQPSPVESARFGLETARMHVGPQTRCSADAVAEAVRRADADLVILRYPADRRDWHATLVRQSGMRVIPTEAILLQTWERPVPADLPTAEPTVTDDEVPAGSSERWSDVAAILGESFARHRAHFRANPYLPAVDLGAVYEEWMHTLAATPGGHVVLWSDRGVPVGVLGYECYEAPDGVRTAELHLIATKPDRAGMFQASLAVLRAKDRMRADGVERVAAVVQTANLGPIVSLLNVGFRPRFTALTLHLVHPRVVASSEGQVS